MAPSDDPNRLKSDPDLNCLLEHDLRACAFRANPQGNRASGFADRALRPLDKAIDDFLLAGLFERDGKLVSINFHDLAVAELLVKHAVVQLELRRGAGGFRNQLALDRDRRAVATAEAARLGSRREW